MLLVVNVRKRVLQVTNKAFAKLKDIQETENAKAIVLGISVKGCSGHTYTFNPTNSKNLGLDSVYRNGTILYISELAKSILADNAKLDLVNEFLSEKLVITNTKVNSVCGCGESFFF